MAALTDRPANLYSDVALHQMGPGLADDILQGAAAGDEFRTAPLWGLGQRIFFLHDGRTSDLDRRSRPTPAPATRSSGPRRRTRSINKFTAWDDDSRTC